MQLQRFENLLEFCRQAMPFLLQQPIHHNLLLEIIGTLARAQQVGGRLPYLAIVKSQDQPVAVALRAAPYGLVLSDITDLAALRAIAQDLAARQLDVLSLNALAPVAEAFTMLWQATTGQTATLSMMMKVHQLLAVAPQAAVSGQLRPATIADHDWALAWYVAFKQTALGVTPHDQAAWWLERLQRQDLFVWQDHEPVAIVCGDVIPGDLGRIFLVYTPPKQRRRGYASAGVAAVSQRLLDRGARSCVLFADWDNPTANKIYQAVGYVPICDWATYKFAP